MAGAHGFWPELEELVLEELVVPPEQAAAQGPLPVVHAPSCWVCPSGFPHCIRHCCVGVPWLAQFDQQRQLESVSHATTLEQHMFFAHWTQGGSFGATVHAAPLDDAEVLALVLPLVVAPELEAAVELAAEPLAELVLAAVVEDDVAPVLLEDVAAAVVLPEAAARPELEALVALGPLPVVTLAPPAPDAFPKLMPPLPPQPTVDARATYAAAKIPQASSVLTSDTMLRDLGVV